MQVLDVYGLFDYVDGDDKTEYTSAEISDFLHPIMGDGVCASDGGEFFATAEGLIVTLTDGRAFLAGRGGKNTAAKTIELEPVSTGMSRIDRIAICVDVANQQMGIEVLQGTQAANPQPPEMAQTDNLYHLPLWQALVKDDSSVELTDQRVMIRTPAQINQSVSGLLLHPITVGATEPSEMAASLGEGDVYIYCPTMAG